MSTSTESGSISTPNEEGDDPSLETVDSDWFRLIPSRFPPVSLYERIISNDRLDELVETEDLTNPRLRRARDLANGIEPADPASPIFQNWNLAPFTYSNPDGTRFFRAIHNCLELAEDLQTALAISVARREAFLRHTEEPPIGLDMRVLKTPIKGRFLDLRHLPRGLSQEDRWLIGEDVIEAGHDGILFRSPHRPTASCIAVLKGSTLGRSQQAQHFRFQWDGARVSSIYAFDDAKPINPELLRGEMAVIAA